MTKYKKQNRKVLSLFEKFDSLKNEIFSAQKNYETDILSYSLSDSLEAINDYWMSQGEHTEAELNQRKEELKELCISCMTVMSGVEPENPKLFLNRTKTEGFLKNVKRDLVDKIDFDHTYWTNVLNNDKPEKTYDRINYLISCFEENKDFYKNFIANNQWSVSTQIQMATQKASDEIRNLKRKIREFRTFMAESKNEK